jgi:hypothetical protein
MANTVDFSHGFDQKSFSDKTIQFTTHDGLPLSSLYVNALVLSQSEYFKCMFTNKMKESLDGEILFEVESEEEIENIKTIIYFMYSGKFNRELTVQDLINILVLADRFDADAVFFACLAKLSTSISSDDDCKRITAILSKVNDLSKFVKYQTKWESIIKQVMAIMLANYTKFTDLFLSDKFLAMLVDEVYYSIKYYLEKDKTVSPINMENDVYYAIKYWWNESKQSPRNDNSDVKYKETIALKFLDLIEFKSITMDYLLDVVKTDKFLIDPAISSVVTAKKTELINEALSFSAMSGKRRQILGKLSDRKYTPETITKTHEFNINDFTDGKYVLAPSFYLGGYWLRLQAGKIRWERSDGFSFALFLSLDIKKSDLTENFFLQTESQFLVKNNSTNLYEPTHLPSFDTFTTNVHELGYFDVFKKSWNEFLNSALIKDGKISISVRAKLLS